MSLLGVSSVLCPIAVYSHKLGKQNEHCAAKQIPLRAGNPTIFLSVQDDSDILFLGLIGEFIPVPFKEHFGKCSIKNI